MSRETLHGIRALRASFPIPVYGAIQDLAAIHRGRKLIDACAILVSLGCLFAVFVVLILIESRFGLSPLLALGGPLEAVSELRQNLLDVFALFMIQD